MGASVNIGTTSPTAPLHVATAGSVGWNSVLKLETTVANTHPLLMFRHAGADSGWVGFGSSSGTNNSFGIFNNLNDDFNLGTNSQTMMTFRPSGNVGIGTTSPAVKLDVAGEIRPGSVGIATGAACNIEGSFAYDLAAHAPVYCNGALVWAAIGSTSSPASAKAWGMFTISGGVVTIKSSFNISSITRVATGNYVVTFATALSNVNYSVSGSADVGTAGYMGVMMGQTTSSFTIFSSVSGTFNEARQISFSVFGN